MIEINLTKFGGGKSGSGGGSGNGSSGSKSIQKKDVSSGGNVNISDFTDSKGNVTRIVNGYRYRVQYPNGMSDKVSANEARDLLDGFTYDNKTGKFVDNNNRNRQYKVTVITKKATQTSNAKSKTRSGSGKSRMMTALVRDKNGNLRTMRYDDYSSQSSYKSELQGNGYKVLKIWNGNKKDAEVDKWEFLNRKGTRTRSGSRSRKK